MTVTAVIITRNAQEELTGCIKSISWVDEVVVVDTDSTDSTRSIAEKLGARVYTKKFEGYGKLREDALEHVSCEWVFYLDADERAEEGLKEELEETTRANKAVVFALPRKNIMLGHWLRYGGWYPDYQTRIFRKSELKGWRGTLHETPVFDGKAGVLTNGLTHITSRSIDAMLEKTKVWSKEEARLLMEAGHPPMNGRRFVSAVARTFFERMVKGQAFRDGAVGVLMAYYQVFSVFLTYARLWELQHKKAIDQEYERH